ncbi:hypothetical protein HHK36_013599 [Tetracentron sinense]|uniref:Carboxypeptidase n=1 Tax=Tetracentron sinense TaxID=13715 RepID=A0A834Z6K8_TETSI|nr:hypothetical protein HHK36_013599 [Tetracentron sinense]
MGSVVQLPTNFGHEMRASLRCRLLKAYDQVLIFLCLKVRRHLPACTMRYSQDFTIEIISKILDIWIYIIQDILDNLVFLQHWFVKFPQYLSRDLFIIGESYAGHYVPQLAELMIQFNKNEKLFNFKGIVLCNPVSEFSTGFNLKG